MDLKPVLVVLLFSTSMLAGCFGESEVVDEIGPSENVYPEPWDRSTPVSYTHLTLPTIYSV